MRTQTPPEPQLYVDSHHGIYSFQFAWQWLKPIYQQQAKDSGFSEDDIKSLETGPDDDFYLDAGDSLMNVEFTEIETGNKFYIGNLEDESDLWFIPLGYNTED